MLTEKTHAFKNSLVCVLHKKTTNSAPSEQVAAEHHDFRNSLFGNMANRGRMKPTSKKAKKKPPSPGDVDLGSSSENVRRKVREAR